MPGSKTKNRIGVVLLTLVTFLIWEPSTYGEHIGKLTEIQEAHGKEYSVSDILKIVTGNAELSIVDPEVRVPDDGDEIFNCNSMTSVTYIASMWGGTKKAEGIIKQMAGFTYKTGDDDLLISMINSKSNSPSSRMPPPTQPDPGIARFYTEHPKYGMASLDPNLNQPLKNNESDRVITFDVTMYAGELVGLDGNSLGTSVEGDNLYLLFFESGMDGDYNDFVILVEGDMTPGPASGPGPEPPEPATISLLAISCLVLLKRSRSL